MTKYIDADKFHHKLYDIKAISHNGFEYVRRGEIADIADKLSTADVQEVKHGKWIKLNKNWPLYSKTYRCSECERTIVVHEGYKKSQLLKQYPYCHCGAKMDAEENNEM